MNLTWYMISDLVDDESMVRLNRKEQLVRVSPEEAGNQMIGIAYILKDDALQLQENMEKLSQYKKNYDMFWEPDVLTIKMSNPASLSLLSGTWGFSA